MTRKFRHSIDRNWISVWRVCLTGVLLTLCALGGTGDLVQRAYAKQVLPTGKRWAIICSPSLQEMGLSDLLTAKLSTEHDFDLVERDLITQVLDELEVVGFSGVSDGANRLKLGEALSADVLTIISTVTAGDKEFLRVVVCECQLGTRLLVAERELETQTEGGDSRPANVEEVAQVCQSWVVQTRSRFADGIKKIVGVSPFRSNALTHRWDHYQKGFQHLLQSALLAYPGVAVIEIDEARTIQQELARSSRPSISRTPLTMLDGTFDFELDNSPAESDQAQDVPLVKFQLNVSGVKPDGFVSALKPMTLEAASKYLSEMLPRQIVAIDDKTDQTISNFSQIEWLSDQAGQFFRRGDWKESAALSEAALLLDPTQVEERRKAIRCYLNICSARCFEYYALRRAPLDNPRLIEIVAERANAFLAYIPNLEYLIRNRMVTANEASAWVRTTETAIAGNARSLVRRFKETARGLEEAEQLFIRRIKPIVLSLPRDFSYLKVNNTIQWSEPIENEIELIVGWDQLLFTSAESRIDRVYCTAKDLDRLFDVLTKEIPEGRPIPVAIGRFFTEYRIYDKRPVTARSKYPDSATPQDWESFLNRLASSGQKNATILARYSRVSYYRYGPAKKERENKERENTGQSELKQMRLDDYEKTERVLKDYLELPYSTNNRQSDRREEHVAKSLSGSLAGLRIELGLAPAKKIYREVAPGLLEIDYSGAAGVVREYPVQIKLKILDGKIEDPMKKVYSGSVVPRKSKKPSADANEVPRPLIRRRPLNLTKCGDVDVWWTRDCIFLMREKGLMEAVISDRQASFLDVLWDGEHAWVSTLYGGIKILDLEKGNFSHQCDSNVGLPPADVELRIIDLAPGKILAIGSFGENLRAWCATVELIDDRTVVDVFHEAVNPAVNADGQPDWTDAGITFVPVWIVPFDPGDGQPKMYLVGRTPLKRHLRQAHRPLVVKPETRSVSTEIFHRALGSYSGGGYVSNRESFYSANGVCILFWQGFARAFIPYFGSELPKAAESDFGERICEVRKGIKYRPRKGHKFPRVYKYVQQDGYLITGGEQWFKLDPVTMKEKRYVSPDPNRVLKSPANWGLSAHYGLIGWKEISGNSFRRFVLEDTDDYSK